MVASARVIMRSFMAGTAIVMLWAGVASGDVRVEDEIKRHVTTECALYTVHGKNQIDFDPMELGVKILPQIHARTWRLQSATVRQILTVMRHPEFRKSFYKRVLAYNVYYRLCLKRIALQEAQDSILRITNLAIRDREIQGADAVIARFYDPRGVSPSAQEKRVKRDTAKITVLITAEALEPSDFIKKKLQSTIRELEHDIELWNWDLKARK